MSGKSFVMNNSIENLLEPRTDKNGRLFIKDTRISVNFIARFWRMGFGAEKIIEEYPHLSPAGIYAALAFYFANRERMDTEIDEEIEAEKRLKFEYNQVKKRRRKEAA